MLRKPPLSRHVTAVTCGQVAREIIAAEGPLHVMAVMEKAVYLDLPEGIVCLAGPGVARGPINIGLAAATERLGLREGDRGRISAARLLFDSGIAVDFVSSGIWCPPPMAVADSAKLQTGLAGLTRACLRDAPSGGLLRLVLDGVRHANTGLSLAGARKPLVRVHGLVRQAIAGDRWPGETAETFCALLGFGPGLTPSGDDLLAGLMMALKVGERDTLSQEMWAMIEPELFDRTTPISAMHLRAAARGMVSEPIHRLIQVVIAGACERLPVQLAAAGAIGHTSGWDTIAGLWLGLGALAAEMN